MIGRGEKRPKPGRVFVLGLVGLALLGIAGASVVGARVITRTEAVSLPGDDGTTEPIATAACPRGKRVILGGVRLEPPIDPDDSISITRLEAPRPRRWSVQGFNFNNIGARELTAVAYCGGAPGRVRVRRKSIVAPTQQGPNDPNSSVTARCPRGKRLLFGGYDQETVTGNDIWIAGAHRRSARAWTVEAVNFGTPALVTAIAYCSARAPRATTVSRTTTVQPNGTAERSASCPRGKRLLFGGYRADVTFNDAFVLLRSLERSSRRKWTVGAVNENGGDAGQLTAFAYCVGA